MNSQSDVPAANSVFNGCDGGDLQGGALFSTADWLSITLINCHFLWCRTSQKGGAIYISSSNNGVTLVGCTFDSCSSPSDSACLFANRCLSFVMNQTVAFNCTGGGVGALCNVGVDDAALGRLDVRECTAAFCRSERDTFCLGFYTYSTGPMSFFQLTNASANWAMIGGTAASLPNHVSLSFRFCQFEGNARGNCLKLSDVVDSNISCLEIVNNSCTSSASGYNGLLAVVGCEATFASCVFQMNVYDAFVGGTEVTVALVGCILDGQPLNATDGTMYLVSASCVYEVTRTGLVECGWDGLAAKATAPPQQTQAMQSGTFTIGWENSMQPRRFWQLSAFVIYALDCE
jgi:hypothetical protein